MLDEDVQEASVCTLVKVQHIQVIIISGRLPAADDAAGKCNNRFCVLCPWFSNDADTASSYDVVLCKNFTNTRGNVWKCGFCEPAAYI